MNKFEQSNTTSTPESSVEQKRLPERPFFEEEKVLLEKTGAEIDAASGKELKKPGLKALAAFLTFLVGSTAFADRALAEREAEHMAGDKNRVEKNIGAIDLELRNTYRMEEPPFNPERIIMELTPEKSSVEGNFETIGLEQLNRLWKDTDPGNFYENLSQQEVQDVVPAYVRALRGANTYTDFKENLKNLGFNDQQKIIFLQLIGNRLGEMYNYDMADKNEHIKISEEDMFQALRGFDEGGICGNIHTFLLRVAQEMGIKDAWLDSGLVGKDDTNGHVWMGMIAKGADGKDQIVYLDYSRIIPTGTLDPVRARGIMERHHKQVSLFNSYVGAEGTVLMPSESLAQRTMKRAGGIKESDVALEEHLREGRIIHSKGLELEASKEITELKVSSDLLGIAYIHYEDNNNPYQALESLDGIRASLHTGDETMGAKLETTVLHLNIKDLEGGIFSQNEIINRLALHFLESNRMTVGEYGTFVANFGLSIEAASRHLMNKPDAKTKNTGHAEESVGLRLAYLNPGETKEVYMGALAKVRVQNSDFEEQRALTKLVSDQLVVGSTVEVHKGVIVNAEQKLARLEYGKKNTSRAGVRVGDISVATAYERVSSEHASIRPDARTVSFEATHHLPQGEIVFFGSKTDEKYNSAKNSTKQLGVIMRVVLW